MAALILYRPAEHEPLTAEPWDEERVRAAIAAVVAEAESALPDDGLWPANERDVDEGDVPPFTVVYLGAAGVAWALAELGSQLDVGPLVERALERYRERPDLGEAIPSTLVGESGLLRVLERFAPDPVRRERLRECVAANVRNESLELLWGAPGTMLAVESLDGFDHLWLESADALWEAWDDAVWTQQIAGRADRLLGAAHGFVGNVRALAGRPDLLGAERLAELERRTVAVLADEALHDGGLVNWPPSEGERRPDKIRVQWCHGAPGVIASTATVAPASDDLTALLVAGGELTWAAGPLRKGPGICHGTAGNGYAFLKLWRRTGDDRWLERARAFAMHAIGQLEGRRFSLWTGDTGAAVYLRSCLEGDARFPTIDYW